MFTGHGQALWWAGSPALSPTSSPALSASTCPSLKAPCCPAWMYSPAHRQALATVQNTLSRSQWIHAVPIHVSILGWPQAQNSMTLPQEVGRCNAFSHMCYSTHDEHVCAQNLPGRTFENTVLVSDPELTRRRKLDTVPGAALPYNPSTMRPTGAASSCTEIP
jgi:hypothetical protein